MERRRIAGVFKGERPRELHGFHFPGKPVSYWNFDRLGTDCSRCKLNVVVEIEPSGAKKRGFEDGNGREALI